MPKIIPTTLALLIENIFMTITPSAAIAVAAGGQNESSFSYDAKFGNSHGSLLVLRAGRSHPIRPT
jgi:hypothetical protein